LIIVPPPDEVTQLLHAWRRGDNAAADRLAPLIYGELHRLAHLYMAREKPGNTLQTTALVHEAWLKLAGIDRIEWKDRVHFFAFSSTVMRRVLVDFARARTGPRRGGDVAKIPLDDTATISETTDEQLVRIDEALNALAAFEPRQARVVEMRYFGGMTQEETAEAMGISPDTVLRDWKRAKRWLWREMTHGRGNDS
jgi:RNA polymerase sigma factor (TIGR02999 family)